MKFSSTVPSVRPRRYCTLIAASLTIVPIDIRCRSATIRLVTTVDARRAPPPAVLGVGLERLAAAGDEVEHPAPLGVGSSR